MTKENVNEGYRLAQEELRQKQINEIKQIVLETLKKIDRLEKEKKVKKEEIKKLEDKIKILKSDIDDLKVGRVDRIVERQEKDPEASKISVVVIIKEKEVIKEPWFQPYVIEHWNLPASQPVVPTVWCGTGIGDVTSNDVFTGDCIPTINCSVAKFAAIGTYNVEGNIINLR